MPDRPAYLPGLEHREHVGLELLPLGCCWASHGDVGPEFRAKHGDVISALDGIENGRDLGGL